MPAQKCVRGDDTGKAQESFSADGLSSHGQSATLGVIELRPFAQLFSKNADFLLEIFNDELLVAIHPTGNAHDQKGQGIHGEIIPSACLRGEHFVGKPTPRPSCKRPIFN